VVVEGSLCGGVFLYFNVVIRRHGVWSENPNRMVDNGRFDNGNGLPLCILPLLETMLLLFENITIMRDTIIG
jgi:hypothetical protein